MAGATVRIHQNTHKLLKEISHKTGQPMQLVLSDAVEDYRRKCFLEEMNLAYETLQANPKAWKELLKERGEWENATADGQDDET